MKDASVVKGYGTEKLVRISVAIPEKMKRDIEKTAKKMNISFSDVVRLGIKNIVKEQLSFWDIQNEKNEK